MANYNKCCNEKLRIDDTKWGAEKKKYLYGIIWNT